MFISLKQRELYKDIRNIQTLKLKNFGFNFLPKWYSLWLKIQFQLLG